MAEPLKNMFSIGAMQQLADAVIRVYPEFDSNSFMKRFRTAEWRDAELKARVRFITNTLHEFLPQKYSEAIDILVKAHRGVSAGYFSIFFPDFVEVYGQDNLQVSMKALEIFTQTSSSEFAIRPFIMSDPDMTMQQMLKWSKSPNHHIRRLSSEGCRPKLPWSFKLQMFVDDPSPILPILENLKDDPELYVRKSVANNLNDISKDHPELVLEIASKWIGKSEGTDWIVKHALRSLLKSGNKKALKLFGHHDAKHFSVGHLMLDSRRILPGQKLRFTFDLVNSGKSEEACRLEYAIDYVKANGSSSKKVFQLFKGNIMPGKTRFSKSCGFEDLSTRKHHPGKHTIYILVNGEIKSSADFMLVK